MWGLRLLWIDGGKAVEVVDGFGEVDVKWRVKDFLDDLMMNERVVRKED